MAAEQVPLPDEEPLLACGVSRLDLRDIRSVVDDWVAGFIKGETERVEYGNGFIWLASLQARERSPGAMLDAMETLARQVLGEEVFPVLEEVKETEGRLVFPRR